MKIRPTLRTESLATVCLTKVTAIPGGEITDKFATGFLYKASDSETWLVTNWHVVTGRRPDNPSLTSSETPRSPSALLVTLPSKNPDEFLELRVELYKDDRPIWREYRLDIGVDLAAIPINLPPMAAGLAIRPVPDEDADYMEPGIDLITVGFPRKPSVDNPYPFWKRGMLASEPGILQFGLPQMLIDIPGTPGMSGSPVFRSGDAYLTDQAEVESRRKVDRGEISNLDYILGLDPKHLADRTVGMRFVGVYAGSTGIQELDELKLGRMFSASFVELLVSEGGPGTNPFPPEHPSDI
jgi:Trypsin-like peptidase domain